MNTLVNEKVIHSLLNKDNFNAELKAMLNLMIDEELEKEPEDMDCDLIDECTDMLIELEQEEDDGFAVMIPLMNSEKIIKACGANRFKYLSRGMRASLIACIILLSALTANTVIAKVFDYNIAQEVVNTISEKLQDWGIIASADNNDEYNEIRIDEIPTTTKKTVIKKEEEKATAKPAAQTKKIGSTAAENTTAENSDTSQEDAQENVTTPTQTESTTKPATETVQPVPAETPSKIYTLSFDANGGKCDTNSIEVTYGKPVGELPVPIREGYEFAGWYNIDISYKRQDGRKYATPLKNTTVYNLECDAAVTAKWNKLYTIHLDPNGGKCSVEKMQISIYSPVADLPVPVKDGYVFLGWTDSKYENIYTTTENLYMLAIENGYVNLFACWVEEEALPLYPVTFDANGGQCDVETKDYVFGKPYGELPVPTKPGYNFLGWFGVKIGDTDISFVPIDENTVFMEYDYLYAKWYRTKATVTFDADGGECDIKNKTIYSDNSYGELPTPTKDGYTFLNWYRAETEQAIFDYTSVGDYAEDHTLIAVWKPVKVTVRFFANGGAMNVGGDVTSEKSYTYMEEYGSLPEASRSGYSFAGWYTEPVGGKKIEVTDIVDFLDTPVYYAHWEKDENNCVVTFHSNDGKDNDSVKTVYKGNEVISLKEPDMTDLEGLFYQFSGWYTDKYYGEKIDDNYVVTENMELYAHWIFNPKYVRYSLVLEKTEYALNEEINPQTISMIVSSFVGETETITPEMLIEANAKYTYDTSTYGNHTLTVTYAVDAGRIITFEASAQIYVTGCTHNAGTYIANQTEATCLTEGYTGDTLCKDCNEILEKGTVTAKTGHNENTQTKVINAKEPTCSQEGYTGDTICALCGEVLQSGTKISTTPHTTVEVIHKASFTENGSMQQVCTVCGNTVSSKTIYSPTVTLSSSVFTYDGTVKTPEVRVTEKNATIITDCTVTMDEGRTEVGQYNIYVTVDTKYYSGEQTATFFIVNELETPIPVITSDANSITINWNAVEGATGYEARYDKLVGGSFGTVTCYGQNNNKAVFRGLEKGMYFVKIRAYQTVNGERVYTSWTTSQLVTVG